MKIAPDQIDSDAAKVVQRLRRYDHKAYLVGGCVRDLLLGGKPKDFDVVTSATPQEIKRLFRNCRIIGRRFRLAHVFFGSKVVETSTFRANPRDVEEDDGEGGAESDAPDLMIRRDNVFGTPEEDARRRDFTINGLFYDIESGEVIDHVAGMADLEARLVRTIGDPDIRLREDPVRILRAIKFAARCDLSIESETYRRMMEHRQEITKCAQARVSEEFYRLLRSGAAKRSMELLVGTELLDILVPELARGLRGDDADDEVNLRRTRLWAYLGALDRQTNRRPVAPSNALILAVLTLPPLRDVLDPDSTGVRDVGPIVAQAISPIMERLKASRRDAELTRQMLLALRYVLPSKRPNRRRPRLAGRDFLDDALRLAELVSDAEATDATVIGRPILDLAGPDVRDGGALEASVDALAGDVPAAADGQSDDDLPPELESTLDRDRDRRRRRGRGDSRRFEEVRRPDEPGRADDAGRPSDAGRPNDA
ncbi:MAG: polynucleotide adenylyltransferase PcnB, partial [Deltaproteobacteria bacterium]|nr:polynucleotide adenylyltransferase PcnB [Deltaproteobacteria bacterium]